MQAIHYVKEAEMGVVAHLISSHNVDPRSKAGVCEVHSLNEY